MTRLDVKTVRAANILVISDLHLGEDLTLAATPAMSRHLQVLERQLVEFLRHYARRRRNGLPWRLVINGDMIDFLAICVLPAQGKVDLPTEQIRDEEHVYGLGRRLEVASAKIRAVVDRHRDVFLALAAFLAAGNSVEIICGNHDAELHWPAVQEALRAAIGEVWNAAPQAARPGAPGGDAIRERIRFHPWFFYEKGVAWIEHGHQYDACSSFDYGLEPVGPHDGKIATNVDAASVRYISARLYDADVHILAEWSFLGYLRFAFSLGVRGLLGVARSYFAFVLSLLRAWRALAPSRPGNRERRQRHFARMRGLSTQWGIPEATLRSVDGLRHMPVVVQLRRLAGAAMLDRLVAGALGFVGAVLALILVGWPWGVPVALAIWIAARLTSRLFERRRVIHPEIALALMPRRILDRIDARMVVFGHTHQPVANPIGDGRFYYNTGSWVPAGKPGALRAFTHLVISHGDDGEVEAALCQWRDGASRAFTPGWVPPRSPRKRTVTPVEGTPAEQIATAA